MNDAFGPERLSPGYAPATELARGVLGTLSMAYALSGEMRGRVVLLRTFEKGAAWPADRLKAVRDSALRARGIHHPSTLGIVDVVESPTALAVATEYVEGVPLAVFADRGRNQPGALDAKIAARIGRDLARAMAAGGDALASAHPEAKLVNVHPECVLITSGDDVVLADLGLAALEPIPNDPRAIAYRAPEILARGITSADPRSLVYSVGLVLWELLAGREAFGQSLRGATPDSVRAQIADGAVPRLDVTRGKLPPLLVEIAMQCVDRDPDSRFPSLKALAEALNAVGGLARTGELGRSLEKVSPDLVEAQRSAQRRVMTAADDPSISGRPTYAPGEIVVGKGAPVSTRKPMPPTTAAPTAGDGSQGATKPQLPRRIGLAAFAPVAQSPTVLERSRQPAPQSGAAPAPAAAANTAERSSAPAEPQLPVAERAALVTAPVLLLDTAVRSNRPAPAPPSPKAPEPAPVDLTAIPSLPPWQPSTSGERRSMRAGSVDGTEVVARSRSGTGLAVLLLLIVLIGAGASAAYVLKWPFRVAKTPAAPLAAPADSGSEGVEAAESRSGRTPAGPGIALVDAGAPEARGLRRERHEREERDERRSRREREREGKADEGELIAAPIPSNAPSAAPAPAQSERPSSEPAKVPVSDPGF